jgi:hypothetical protein
MAIFLPVSLLFEEKICQSNAQAMQLADPQTVLKTKIIVCTFFGYHFFGKADGFRTKVPSRIRGFEAFLY